MKYLRDTYVMCQLSPQETRWEKGDNGEETLLDRTHIHKAHRERKKAEESRQGTKRVREEQQADAIIITDAFLYLFFMLCRSGTCKKPFGQLFVKKIGFHSCSHAFKFIILGDFSRSRCDCSRPEPSYCNLFSYSIFLLQCIYIRRNIDKC